MCKIILRAVAVPDLPLDFFPLVLQTKQKMSEDDLERLLDALEKMHHAEIQKHPEQWANLIGSPIMARCKLLSLLTSL